MTTWGNKLAGVDEEQLLAQLRTETDAKAVKRLTSALLRTVTTPLDPVTTLPHVLGETLGSRS